MLITSLFFFFLTWNKVLRSFCCFLSNQIFHYNRSITPNRVTSLRGPSPRLLKKYCRDGEPLTILYPI